MIPWPLSKLPAARFARLAKSETAPKEFLQIAEFVAEKDSNSEVSSLDVYKPAIGPVVMLMRGIVAVLSDIPLHHGCGMEAVDYFAPDKAGRSKKSQSTMEDDLPKKLVRVIQGVVKKPSSSWQNRLASFRDTWSIAVACAEDISTLLEMIDKYMEDEEEDAPTFPKICDHFNAGLEKWKQCREMTYTMVQTKICDLFHEEFSDLEPRDVPGFHAICRSVCTVCLEPSAWSYQGSLSQQARTSHGWLAAQIRVRLKKGSFSKQVGEYRHGPSHAKPKHFHLVWNPVKGHC